MGLSHLRHLAVSCPVQQKAPDREGGGLNSVAALGYWYRARAAVISAWIAGT